ncbi:hypothetical protein ROZALSC1DRAFT_23264 [Rozella allomycis CSF55]|uniref:Uncharacterized protein n=1 Tax=Rozella allomycis (strain CSF55) TaxID=988480 RepID=A0A4P9YG10_ROZAC|nr:hypothetical protein ROZALSC1DRAFT_23264 [Rozella allomycis CSF55]
MFRPFLHCKEPVTFASPLIMADTIEGIAKKLLTVNRVLSVQLPNLSNSDLMILEKELDILNRNPFPDKEKYTILKRNSKFGKLKRNFQVANDPFYQVKRLDHQFEKLHLSDESKNNWGGINLELNSEFCEWDSKYSEVKDEISDDEDISRRKKKFL